MKRWILLMSATASVALLGGCSGPEQAQVEEQVQGARQEVGAAAVRVQDAAANAALSAKVKSALSLRKGMDTRAIDVDAQDGVVTLRGDVADAEQAALAQKIASETDGVRAVVNQLMVVTRTPARTMPGTASSTTETVSPLGPGVAPRGSSGVSGEAAGSASAVPASP